MAHARTQIRAQVVNQIAARDTFAGRVFPARSRSTEVGELPVALVYTLQEKSEHVDVKCDLQRILTVAVEIKGRATGKEEVADVIDTLAAEVEAALYADMRLGGLAVGLELVQSAIDLDPSGDARDATSILQFNVLYVTSKPGS